MSSRNIDIGKAGEEIAVKFLKDKGYKIIKTNYRTKLGQIDIIAKDKDAVCFVEVKTRTNLEKGLPQESITKGKQHQISKAALLYLKENNLMEAPARFDVVSVFSDGFEDKIDLIQNAFELSAPYSY